jgi:periplasmic protein TonB
MLSNSEQRERKSRIIAIAGTILVHALILVLLLFLALRSRMLIQEDETVQVNFSYNNDSLLETQPIVPALPPDSIIQPIQNKAEIQMITKKDAEPTAIEKNKKKTVISETAYVGKPTAIVETPHEQTIIRKPETPIKSNKTSAANNQNVAAKPSDQGKPGETPLSPKSNNNGGTVSGVSFDLDGRGSVFLQKPIFNPPVEGKIIVTIIVDKEGKVIFASASSKGTTISDYKLRQQAENAARKSLFAPDKNAPGEQHGTITYVFVK